MHGKKQIQALIKIVFGISQVILFLIGVFIIISSITIFIREKELLNIKWMVFLYALIFGKLCISIGVSGSIILSRHTKSMACVYTSMVVTLMNIGFILLLITPQVIEHLPEWSNKRWDQINTEQRNFIQLQLECCGFNSKEDRPGTECAGNIEPCLQPLIDLSKMLVYNISKFSFFIFFVSSINLIILSMLKMK
ncbi:hypothetical protein TCON_0062 [Astathelohania contejeani]|uniref:Tetraspanin n=1 Tax=Astathelohania contejeani TaxID=164912 RepID=A0ABQ7I2Z0_9MICR|nr:hypothetical protein TCON_0062 [Thelohania contejeani]